LIAYLEGTAYEELPTLKMLRAPVEQIKVRADHLAERLAELVPNLVVDVASSTARSGGGTLPLYEIPSYAVRIGGDADALADKLRSAAPPIVGRVGEERLWLDVRTLLDGDEEHIVGAMKDVGG
jgi:L-seryl-tRNA(Ser) seleniumtransferase